jgi:hypothetical protein
MWIVTSGGIEKSFTGAKTVSTNLNVDSGESATARAISHYESSRPFHIFRASANKKHALCHWARK